MEPASSEERARLIATAEMVLEGLMDVRARQPSTADIQIVERWITRVAGVRSNLGAITEWQMAEAYPVNALHPGEPLRRLFPNGLDDADFETELIRLEPELERAELDRKREPPLPPMTADDMLEDLLSGHAGGRFRYLDVRSVDAWRRERLPESINIPFERLPEEAPKVFMTDTHLVVFGDDDSSTEAAAHELKKAAFEHVLAIPRGFPWFKQRGWAIDAGPNRG